MIRTRRVRAGPGDARGGPRASPSRPGDDDHAARALVNLATGDAGAAVATTSVPPRDLDRALAFATRDATWTATRSTCSACARTSVSSSGAWPAAEADARRLAGASASSRGVSLCPALLALGRLQARRGEAAAVETLDEAWRLAVATGELQRLAPGGGRPWPSTHGSTATSTRAPTAARAAYDLARSTGTIDWARGELALVALAGGRARRAADAAPPSRSRARSLGTGVRAAEACNGLSSFSYEAAQDAQPC